VRQHQIVLFHTGGRLGLKSEAHIETKTNWLGKEI